MERVEEGTRQVDQAGATMDEVVRAISQVNSIVGEISQSQHGTKVLAWRRWNKLSAEWIRPLSKRRAGRAKVPLRQKVSSSKPKTSCRPWRPSA